MTVSQAELIREAHRRGRSNQPRMRKRVNSGLSALFGTGFVATAVAAGLDAAPWWVMAIVAAALAVGEVLSQAFSKGPLTPSQEDTLAEQVEAIEAEANPEPTALELKLAELAGSVESMSKDVTTLREEYALEARAAAEADKPDPVEALRAEAQATLARGE